MPDITMCSGGKCLLRETCWRFIAKPNMRQSYFCKVPDYRDNKCEFYWEATYDAPQESKAKGKTKPRSKRGRKLPSKRV